MSPSLKIVSRAPYARVKAGLHAAPISGRAAAARLSAMTPAPRSTHQAPMAKSVVSAYMTDSEAAFDYDLAQLYSISKL